MSSARWTALAILCCGSGGVLGAQPEPLGAEFQVNTYTTEAQERAAMDVGRDGRFVVVWRSYYSDIRARRFAPDGTPLGEDFRVNTLDSYDHDPAVAMAATGDFVIAWGSYGSVGGTDPAYTIVARRFAADGTPQGPEFQINSFTTGEQNRPRVAYAPSGGFIAVWQSAETADGDVDLGIVARRFAADGTPLADDFQINSYTTSQQYDPSIGVADSGEFVVVWSSLGSDGDDDASTSIQGRRFAADGTALGEQFQVNTYTPDRQWEADLAVRPDGDFMVTWMSYGSAGDDPDVSVQARLFAADGTPLGDDFQVNTYTPNEQVFPAVGAAAPAQFVVTWSSYGSTGSDIHFRSAQARVFSPDGTATSDDFQVNTLTPGHQTPDAVAVGPNGDFVIVWTGSSPADPSLGILGQRFRSRLPVFADGFESGDTSAWSDTVP